MQNVEYKNVILMVTFISVYSESGGRHVIAKRNIIAGEAIVIEEPVSAHLSPCFMDSNCIHCLRRSGVSVLPSPVDPKAR